MSILELHSQAMQKDSWHHRTVMLISAGIVLHISHQPWLGLQKARLGGNNWQREGVQVPICATHDTSSMKIQPRQRMAKKCHMQTNLMRPSSPQSITGREVYNLRSTSSVQRKMTGNDSVLRLVKSLCNKVSSFCQSSSIWSSQDLLRTFRQFSEDWSEEYCKDVW